MRIWDAATGHPLGAPMAHPRRVLAVAFSPDGQTLLTGGADGVARCWDLGTRTQRVIPLFHSGPIYCVAFRPDGKAVLVGGGDGTVRLWELESQGFVEFALGFYRPSESPLAAFSKDGRTFFNGKWLREVATGRPIGPPLASGSDLSAVALGPDGKSVFTAPAAGMNGTFSAHLWDATTGSRVGPPLESLLPFSSAAFRPDGRTLVAACSLNTLRWFDAATGKALGEPVTAMGGGDYAIFGPDARFFLTASQGFRDLISLDGTSFTSDSGKWLWIWDEGTRKPVGEVTRGKSTRYAIKVLALAFRPDGGAFLTGATDGTASFWDIATARPLGEPLAHPAAVRAVAFSPDGKRVFTGCDDGAARLWDAASGRPLGTPLTHRGPVLAVAFSPDGKTLLTGGDDSTVQAWDTMTLRPLGRPLSHPAPVVQLAFSPDGRTFRALMRDGRPPLVRSYRLRVWNAAELPDDLPRVEDWVHLLTNLSFDARGTIKILDQESVVKLRRRIGNPESLDIAGMGDELAPIPEAWAGTDPGQSLLGRAQRLWSEGKYEDVVATLRDAVRLTPQDHLAHIELGRALGQLGRFDEALVECREALRLKPNDGWAQQVHGWILLGKENWDGALAEYRKAKENGRLNDPSLYHQMGIALLGKGQIDEAIAQFRTAVATNPFGRKIFEPARDSLAWALRDAGRMTELVDEFRVEMGRDRNDAMARVHYCRALLWAGRLDESIAASREAVRMMPDFGPAWQVLAYGLFTDRDWDGAISAYREALRRGPDNPAAHDELGIALRGRGRLDEALPEFERAVAMAPRVPEFSRELAATRRHQVLAPRLPAVLRGVDRPAKATEWLDFAYICDNRKLHAAAARMFAEAFKADPRWSTTARDGTATTPPATPRWPRGQGRGSTRPGPHPLAPASSRWPCAGSRRNGPPGRPACRANRRPIGPGSSGCSTNGSTTPTWPASAPWPRSRGSPLPSGRPVRPSGPGSTGCSGTPPARRRRVSHTTVADGDPGRARLALPKARREARPPEETLRREVDREPDDRLDRARRALLTRRRLRGSRGARGRARHRHDGPRLCRDPRAAEGIGAGASGPRAPGEPAGRRVPIGARVEPDRARGRPQGQGVHGARRGLDGEGWEPRGGDGDGVLHRPVRAVRHPREAGRECHPGEGADPAHLR